MTWFRVDDGLHAHMKAVRAGVPAMGLWLLAGSWSSNQLTDGWVPDYIVARLDPDYREHAADLVRAGLWIEDEHNGDKGWRFHQWDEHQPSSESVLAKREAARERMRRVREHRNASSQDVRANVRANIAGSAPNPDPTRPDPTIKDLPSGGLFDTPPPASSDSNEDTGPKKSTGKRGRRIPDDFAITAEMIAWARENTPNVGATETEAFIDYFRGAPGSKGVKTDWIATWRNWMRRAQSDFMEGRNRQGGRMAGGMRPLSESNAPKRYAPEDRCTTHPNYPAVNCGPCRADRLVDTGADQ